MNRSDYFLIDSRGYFFYALYANSNFLGHSRDWALFTKRFGAALYSTYQDAEAHKEYLCATIRRVIQENVDRYATRNNLPPGWVDEYKRTTNNLLKRFEKLTVYERVRQLEESKQLQLN